MHAHEMIMRVSALIVQQLNSRRIRHCYRIYVRKCQTLKQKHTEKQKAAGDLYNFIL